MHIQVGFGYSLGLFIIDIKWGLLSRQRPGGHDKKHTETEVGFIIENKNIAHFEGTWAFSVTEEKNIFFFFFVYILYITYT